MSELKPCLFSECPPGVFLFSGGLFFKSEYGNDAYCISSGEMFWGGTSEASCRAKLVVYPIEYEAIEAAWNRRAQPDNEPLTCEGCEYETRPLVNVCGPCRRFVKLKDYYRRKPEPEE